MRQIGYYTHDMTFVPDLSPIDDFAVEVWEHAGSGGCRIRGDRDAAGDVSLEDIRTILIEWPASLKYEDIVHSRMVDLFEVRSRAW